MRKLTRCFQTLSVILLFLVALNVSSCDSPPEAEKTEAEEPKERSAEEVQEALKKKQEEKESEARKVRNEGGGLGKESLARTSPGTKKR